MNKILFIVFMFSSLSAFAQVHVIGEPRYFGENIAYSSSANGICKYLGFEKALKGSKRKAKGEGRSCFGIYLGLSCPYKSDAVVLNKHGEPKKYKRGSYVASLRCLHY